MFSRKSKYRLSSHSVVTSIAEEDGYCKAGDVLYIPAPDYDLEDVKVDSLKTYDKKSAGVRRGKSRLYSLDSVSPGDAISFKRKGYKHHAIVSDVVNKSRFFVIHLTGDSADSISSSFVSSGPKATISETAIEFNEKNVIFKYQYENKRTDGKHPLEVAKTIFRNGLPHSYNFLKFNCEHFICYCVTGVVFSKQTGKENKIAAQKLDEVVRGSREISFHTAHDHTRDSVSFYITDGSNNAYMNLNPEEKSRYAELHRNRESRRLPSFDTSMYYPNQENHGYYNCDGYERYMYKDDEYVYAVPTDIFY